MICSLRQAQVACEPSVRETGRVAAGRVGGIERHGREEVAKSMNDLGVAEGEQMKE